MEIQDGARIARRSQRRWAWVFLMALVLGCSVYVICRHHDNTASGDRGDGQWKTHGELGSVQYVMDGDFVLGAVKESLHVAKIQHPLEGLAKFFMAFAAVSAPPGVRHALAAVSADDVPVVSDPKLTTLIDQLTVPVTRLADTSPTPWFAPSQQAAQTELEHAFLEKTYVETWKSDISNLLHKPPRWDMFAKNVKVVDQTGAGVEGGERADLLFATLRETFANFGVQGNIKVDYVDGQRMGQQGGIFVAHWKAQLNPRKPKISPMWRSRQYDLLNIEAVTVFKLDKNNQVDTIWLNEWLVNGSEMISYPDVKLPGIGEPSNKGVQKESLKRVADVLVGGNLLLPGEQATTADGDASSAGVEGISAVFAKLQDFFKEKPEGIVVLPVEAGMKMNMEEFEKSMSKAKAQVTGHLPRRQTRSSSVAMSAAADDSVPNMKRRTIMNLVLLGGAAVPVGSSAGFFTLPEGGGKGGLVALDKKGAEVTFESWLNTHEPGDRELVQGLKGDPHFLIVTGNKEIEDYALNAVCTHLGCLAEWQDGLNKFICPCHGSQYDTTGAVIRGPAPSSLALAHVTNVDGKVFLTPWTEPDWRGSDLKKDDDDRGEVIEYADEDLTEIME